MPIMPPSLIHKSRTEKRLASAERPRLVQVLGTSPAQKRILHPYSNSRLEDLAMCPTWGVVHAQRKYKSDARSMALECGELMHQVFAAVRIWQLSKVQKLDAHAQVIGRRIYKSARWNAVWNRCMTQTDERDQLLELCFGVLQSSGWKDDERDQTRTMTNMELASICYADESLPKMDNWPIYVEDKANPQSVVGIEQVFDVVLTYEDNHEIRYVGTIDGLVVKTSTGEYYLDENKTASRLGDAWRNAFDMRHQVTGYCAASTS